MQETAHHVWLLVLYSYKWSWRAELLLPSECGGTGGGVAVKYKAMAEITTKSTATRNSSRHHHRQTRNTWSLRAQTLEESMEKMGRYNMLPKTSQAGAEAGGPNIVPQKYLKREVVKGTLRPVGRFRGPLPTRTNASTLHLFGPGLSSFAAWQVRSTRTRCASTANKEKRETAAPLLRLHTCLQL